MSEVIDLTWIIKWTWVVSEVSKFETQATIKKLFLPVLSLELVHKSLKKWETLESKWDKCLEIREHIYDKFKVVKDWKIIRVSLEDWTVYLFDGKTFLLI